jgi:cytochrome c-type biogenesis protein CcmH
MIGRTRRVAGTDTALLLAIAVVAVSVALAALAAPSADLDDRARAIEAQLRCPTCQGLSIADSPATSATQMRALVREQLAGGASDDQVRTFFVSRYGRWILLDPPLGGPDLALWLAPVVIVAAGVALVVRRARSLDRTRLLRGWNALPVEPASRLSTVLIGGAMVLALAVPIAVAVGPRLAGAQISGGAVPQTAPSIEELEAFVRAEPRDVEALVALGDALLAAERTGDATDRYKAALHLDPENVPALLGVGAILLAADRPDAAGPVFERVLALSPDQPDALFYRAMARLRLAGAVSDGVQRDLERFLEVASPEDPRRAMATGLLGSPAAPPARSAPSEQGSPEP